MIIYHPISVRTLVSHLYFTNDIPMTAEEKACYAMPSLEFAAYSWKRWRLVTGNSRYFTKAPSWFSALILMARLNWPSWLGGKLCTSFPICLIATIQVYTLIVTIWKILFCFIHYLFIFKIFPFMLLNISSHVLKERLDDFWISAISQRFSWIYLKGWLCGEMPCKTTSSRQDSQQFAFKG